MTRSSRSNGKLKPDISAQLAFEAIGTQWSIELFGMEAVPPALLKTIQTVIEQFDKYYSRFRADSLIAEMSRKSGTYTLPDNAKPLFDLYRQLYKLTDGLMTPLIGQTLSDAGYDAQYSLKPRQLQAPPAWGDVLEYDFPKLTLHKPALLDVGAAGKGYLVDLVAKVIEQHGISAYCIDAGGDMTYRHPDKPLKVGLEHPDKPDEIIGIASLQNQSLCGSAGNRRRWAEYHHIINPEALVSPDHVKAVWVCADSTLLADGLATALFFVSPQRLKRHYNFRYAIVSSDNAVEYSPDFPGMFFN